MNWQLVGPSSEYEKALSLIGTGELWREFNIGLPEWFQV